MDKTQATKSPANQVVGRLIRRLREQKRLTVEEIARIQGLSPSYQRSIESGAVAVPAYAAVGLAKALGVDFFSCSGLLTLVSYLDIRQPNTRYFDLAAVQARAENLVADFPDFAEMLRWVSSAVDITRREEDPTKVTSLLAGDASIVEWLERVLVSRKEATPAPLATGISSRGWRNRDDLSPIFEDVIDGVENLLDDIAGQLALFPPHVNPKSFGIWERSNEHRVLNVWAYLSYQLTPEHVMDPGYGWPYMWNEHRPTLSVVYKADGSKPKIVQNRVVDALQRLRASYNRGDAKSGDRWLPKVKFVQDTGHQKQLAACLTFDFVERTLAPINDPPETRQERIASGRYRQFSNVWVYELEHRYPHGRSRDEGGRLVATLDGFSPESQLFYAVALSRIDTRRTLKLLQTALRAS